MTPDIRPAADVVSLDAYRQNKAARLAEQGIQTELTTKACRKCTLPVAPGQLYLRVQTTGGAQVEHIACPTSVFATARVTWIGA